MQRKYVHYRQISPLSGQKLVRARYKCNETPIKLHMRFDGTNPAQSEPKEHFTHVINDYGF